MVARESEVANAEDGLPRRDFRGWLLAQKDREGAIVDLISAAKADRAFMLLGSPDDIRKRPNEMRDDSDMHAVVDDAETNWLSY